MQFPFLSVIVFTPDGGGGAAPVDGPRTARTKCVCFRPLARLSRWRCRCMSFWPITEPGRSTSSWRISPGCRRWASAIIWGRTASGNTDAPADGGWLSLRAAWSRGASQDRRGASFTPCSSSWCRVSVGVFVARANAVCLASSFTSWPSFRCYILIATCGLDAQRVCPPLKLTL